MLLLSYLLNILLYDRLSSKASGETTPEYSYLHVKSGVDCHGVFMIGHVTNIPTMQFFNGISRNTLSKSYMPSLTECGWEFQNHALWDTADTADVISICCLLVFVFTVLLGCLLQSLHGSWEDLPDVSHCDTPLLSTKISQSQNSTASNPPSNDSLNHSDNDCSLNHTYTDHSVNQSKQVPGLQHSRKDQSNSVSSIPMAPNKTDHVVSSEPKANAGSPNINGSDSNIVTNSDTSSIASNDGESQRVGSSDLPEETNEFFF